MAVEKKWRQIEGRNPVLEALRSGREIFKIVMDEAVGGDEKIREILSLCQKSNILIEKRGRKNVARLSATQSGQGIIAYAPDLETYSLGQILAVARKQKRDPLIVILPKVLYEYNLGAIVRTCEAAGADCLVINRKTRIGPAVSRASMGAIEYLPLVYENLFRAADILHDEAIPIVAADMDADKTYYKEDLSGPLGIILGSEDKGISTSLEHRVDRKVKIPMLGKITSLNMSVAAGILLYEAVRQRSVKSGR